MPTTELAIERLSGRISTLNDLYSRGIVSGALLRKQIKSLLSSRDAKVVFNEKIESNKKAYKILNRLENPVEWRDLFAKNQKDRENSFYLAIENLLGNNSDGRQQILSMLELACLPFYSSFLPFTEEKKSKAAETKTSRVSVLD